MFADLSNTLSEEMIPTEFFLGQNYPNPFREKTFIKYCVAYRIKVILKIYDSDGKEVGKLVDEEQNPGTYEVEFAKVKTGYTSSLQRQTFTYRFEAGNYKCEKKMILMK